MSEPVILRDIASTGTAQPTAAILAGAMMLEHLGHPELAARIDRAVREDLREHGTTARSTSQVGDDVVARLGA